MAGIGSSGGSFFGGLAQGWAAAGALEDKKAARDLARAKKEQEDMLKKLEAQRRIRPLIEDAYKNLGEDTGQLGKAIDDIFSAYSVETGEKVDPDVIKAFKDPAFGPTVLDASQTEGVTLGQVFEQGRQPLLRAEARVAAGAHAKRMAQQSALSPGQRPQQAPEPGGTGLRYGDLAGGTVQLQRPFAGREQPGAATAAPEAASAPAAGGLQAPTPGLQAAVAHLDGRIADLEQRKAAFIRANGDPKVGEQFDKQITQLREQRFQLVEKPELESVTEGRQRLSPTEAQALRDDLVRTGRRDLALRIRDGMPRSAADALRTEAGGSSARVGGPISPTVNQDTGTPIPSGPSAPAPGLTSVEQAEQKADLEVRTRQRQDQLGGTARVSADRLKDYGKAATDAKATRPAIELIGAQIDKLGPTGKIVGPLRQAIFQIGTLFGARPEVLSTIDTVDSMNIFLASQTLKDLSGPDSDRDFLRAMERNPGLRRTPEANRALVQLALRELRMKEERSYNANRWAGAFGSLDSKDPKTGRTFDEGWDEYAAKQTPVVTKETLDSWMKKPKKGRS